MENKFEDLPEKTLLRPDEVASFLRVSIKTVYRWYAKRQLRGVKVKRSVRIYRESVIASMSEGQE
jgi:excisionase family DNA binding protein